VSRSFIITIQHQQQVV